MTELPESIGDLANLAHLDLESNKLTGEFPRTFLARRNQYCTQYLTTEQRVSTELPLSIGSLTNLTDLSVRNNLLTGEFPRSFLAPSKCSTR